MTGDRSKSRRRVRTVAVVVFISALAFFDWSAIWEWAAYRAPENTLGLQMRWKRHGWIPGPDVHIPLQPCPECASDRHEECARERGTLILDGSAYPGLGTLRPFSGAVHFTRFVQSSSVGGKVRIECDQFELGGVVFDSASFECPCCTDR